MCPTVAKWSCDISAHGLHSHLQTVITFLFQIQIEHLLKLWTPDFPRFETRYCMHNLNFGKWSKCVQQLPKWGCGCEIGIFHILELRSRFAATKWGSLCCEMALVCQKVASQLWNPLRNGAFPTKMGSFMLWWFAAVSQLRNGSHCAAKWHSCAKIGFAASKLLAEWDFWLRNWEFSRFGASQSFRSCEMRVTVLRNGLVCQKCFRNREILCGMGLLVRN